MTNGPLAIAAIEEINLVKEDCSNLLQTIIAFCPPENGQYQETFRLIAMPMLYSAWERCFTLCHAIALKLIRDTSLKPCALSPSQRAVWLLKSPFYRSLVDHIRGDLASRTEKKGEFSILSEFLINLDDWFTLNLDQGTMTDELVMTFSNVNPDVVEINAKAIGIDQFPAFKKLKLGRLHDLVGQRNGIGHGAIIDPPPNETFIQLFEFTRHLVNDYCQTFIDWISETFPDSHSDACHRAGLPG